MLQAYILNVSFISNICYNKYFMLQVFLLTDTKSKHSGRQRRSPRGAAACGQASARAAACVAAAGGQHA
jgi:hypothetical protein